MRSVPLLIAALLVGPAAAAEESAGTAKAGPVSSPDDVEANPSAGARLVPEIALPGATGIIPTGNGSGPSAVVEVQPEEAGTPPDTEDLPAWLGRVTGLAKPPPPGERKAPDTRHLTLVPFVSSSPVTGVGFGVAVAGTAQLGHASETSLSKYTGSFTITTNSQYAFTARHSVNLPGDEWSVMGVWRWTKWPSPTWGIGGNTPESAKSTLDYQLVRAWELLNRRLVGRLYVGVGYFLDFYYAVSNGGTAGGQPSDFSLYPFGTGSTTLNSSPALNLLWDSRDSPVYPTRGIFAGVNFTFSPTWLGSSTSWQALYADFRTYFALTERFTLALWSFGRVTFGDVPYLSLSSNGSDFGERSSRGYIQGRHIGKSILDFEAEMRFTIWEWLGAAVGGNVHSVSQPGAGGVLKDDPRFQYWYPAVTAGLRLLAVSATRSNICLDYAVGLDGNHGFYLSFNEAF